MSGAHRIVRQHTRPDLLKPARVVWGWCSLRAGNALLWLGERFDRRAEAFWDEPIHHEDPRDPIPVLPAPVPVAEPESAPRHLTPREACASLHAEQPHLPGQLLRWHMGADVVHGEVIALECGPTQQRAIVHGYAHVLGVDAAERDAGDGHTVVTATGVHAGVTVIVSAVLLAENTVPLRVYDEAALDPTVSDDTLTTQAIPPKLLAEVLGQ